MNKSKNNSSNIGNNNSDMEYPKFEELKDIFDNNVKIYNNFVEGNLANFSQNKTTQTNNSSKKEFSTMDLLNSISPTTNKILESFQKFTSEVGKNPNIYFDHINKWMTQITSLNFYFVSKLSNQEALPITKEDKTDKRFSSEEWTQNLFFDFVKQFYLITSQLLESLIESVEFPDPKQKELMRFYIKQLNMAFSPSNFVFSNPQVLMKTFEENGNNLIRGFENFRQDYLKHPNKLFISQTSFDDFKVGENLATTPGKVIFKNDIFELIHYNSETDTQFEKPLLIIPPFINKFYIMDLNEKKSMMKYLVENKMNTFLVSWKNPTSDSKDFGFEEYVDRGVLKAIEIACEETKSKEINLASYCVGGTLVAMVLAYLEQKPIPYKINSATFFASLIDFTDPGDLGIFISEEQIKAIEEQMNKTGFFDGKDMAAAFNFLRPGDLYWNYVVNNYLLGNKPSAFDMLYWNSDSTRLPAKLHSDYLRSMYLNNKIVKKEYKFKDLFLDLSKIKTPMFHVATTEDHIAPWKSVFSGLKNYSNQCKFILANSGHIAGIIQGKGAKPGKQYFYENSNSDVTTNPTQWLDSADKKDGSWWPQWISWLEQFSGKAKQPKELIAGKFKPIYNAPGEYVVEK
ncbi:MAG: class I poly(R)-hydroxyalkanoic acid synthase [Proteobacteria bacterium]|nr:class I poly(R)-hydroxyalkanoic acid synthase [Pseudomonadota bacterium]